MSATGLHSGVYKKLRDFAELLDSVLVTLKTGQFEQKDPRLPELGSHFLRLARPQADAPIDHFIATLVCGPAGPSASRLGELASQLAHGQVSRYLLDDLERIAALLEHERTATFAKMRGL